MGFNASVVHKKKDDFNNHIKKMFICFFGFICLYSFSSFLFLKEEGNSKSEVIKHPLFQI